MICLFADQVLIFMLYWHIIISGSTDLPVKSRNYLWTLRSSWENPILEKVRSQWFCIFVALASYLYYTFLPLSA